MRLGQRESACACGKEVRDLEAENKVQPVQAQGRGHMGTRRNLPRGRQVWVSRDSASGHWRRSVNVWGVCRQVNEVMNEDMMI